MVKGSEEYKEYLRSYLSTHTAREACEFFGVSKCWVYKHCKALGVSPAKGERGPNAEMRARSREFARVLSVDGLTLEQCGRKFGVTKQRISQLLERTGYRRVWVDAETFEKIYGKA